MNNAPRFHHPLQRGLLASVLGLCVTNTNTSLAAILRVPADHPTLQAAINAAGRAGDEIRIATGTYRERAVVEGKQLVIVGEPGAVLHAWPEAPSDAPPGLLTIGNDADVVVRGLKFDGGRLAQVHASLMGGLIFSNGRGKAEQCVFQGFRGTQQLGSTVSVATYVGCSDEYEGPPIHVVLQNNEYSDNAYSIYVASKFSNSDPDALWTTFALQGNTVRGLGPTTLGYQVGVFIAPGTSGLIKGNRIEDHFATITSPNQRHSAAILMTYDENHLPHKAVRMEGNTLIGNQQGIAISEGNGVEIVRNVIQGRGTGVSHHGIVLTGDRAVIAENQISAMPKGILLLDAANRFLGWDTKLASQTLILGNRFCEVGLPVQQDAGVWGTVELGTLACPAEAAAQGTLHLAPTAAVAGESVILSGEGLEHAQYVLFDGAAAEFATETNADGATLLRAVVPPRARSGRITVVGESEAPRTTVEFSRILPLTINRIGSGDLQLMWPFATEDFALEFTQGTVGGDWMEAMTSQVWTESGYRWSTEVAEPAAFYRLRQR